MKTMSQIAVSVVVLLLLTSCASTPDVTKAPESPAASAATPQPTSPAVETRTEILADWDSAVASSDVVGMYKVTLDLPDAVKRECYSTLNSLQIESIEKTEAEARAAVEQENAAKGETSSMTLLRYWGSYVTAAKVFCKAP